MNIVQSFDEMSSIVVINFLSYLATILDSVVILATSKYSKFGIPEHAAYVAGEIERTIASFEWTVVTLARSIIDQ